MTMSNIAKYSAFLFVALLIISCGSDPEVSDTHTIRGLKYVVLENKDNSLKTDDNNLITGTGAIAFSDPLKGGVNSDHHIPLSFKLDEGGSISLVTHSASNLKDGIEIRLFEAEHKLRGEVIVAGQKKELAPHLFHTLDPHNDISLKFEIHNGHSGAAHVMIFHGNEDRLTSAHAIFDSARHFSELNQKGKNQFWGLKLTKSTINSIERKDHQVHDHGEHDDDDDHEGHGH